MRLGWRLKAQEDESFCVGVLSIRVCGLPRQSGRGTQLKQWGYWTCVWVWPSWSLCAKEKPLNADDDDDRRSSHSDSDLDAELDVAYCRKQ